jgi:hypothetical protein
VLGGVAEGDVLEHFFAGAAFIADLGHWRFIPSEN